MATSYNSTVLVYRFGPSLWNDNALNWITFGDSSISGATLGDAEDAALRIAAAASLPNSRTPAAASYGCIDANDVAAAAAAMTAAAFTADVDACVEMYDVLYSFADCDSGGNDDDEY